MVTCKILFCAVYSPELPRKKKKKEERFVLFVQDAAIVL